MSLYLQGLNLTRNPYIKEIGFAECQRRLATCVRHRTHWVLLIRGDPRPTVDEKLGLNHIDWEADEGIDMYLGPFSAQGFCIITIRKNLIAVDQMTRILKPPPGQPPLTFQDIFILSNLPDDKASEIQKNFCLYLETKNQG